MLEVKRLLPLPLASPAAPTHAGVLPPVSLITAVSVSGTLHVDVP
jgi:hypothetical protein